VSNQIYADLLDQADALGKLAPGNEHGMVCEFVGLAVAHGSPPHKAAKSVAEQGSVVKVQVFAEKSISASGCTKLALAVEDGVKAAHACCILGEKVLHIASSNTNTAGHNQLVPFCLTARLLLPSGR
jgi:hypothetical protein